MMKNKFLLAGLMASAAFVGCTNDEFLETAGNQSAEIGGTTLICEGIGVDTKMAYDGKGFKWQVGDLIGVRRINGNIVISNTKFEAKAVTDDNTLPLNQWKSATGDQGDYPYFVSTDNTLHEADYIVTYPYDETSVQDGLVTGKLAKAQVSNENDGTAHQYNEYAGEYGFMMSTATHMNGGQNTEYFTLYPVFSRLKINITESIPAENIQLQSIILESQDGVSKIFPTELQVSADVQVVDGFLDPAKMTPVEDSKVSEIAVTTQNTALSADEAVVKYMTLIPGKYENVQLRINTNQGYFIYKPKGAITHTTGRAAEVNINIDEPLKEYTEYVVASQVDWEQALTNIAGYKEKPSIGTKATIKVVGPVQIAADKFRADNLSTKHTITVEDGGNGSILVVGDMADKTGIDLNNSLGIMTFNVPVTVAGDATLTTPANFYAMANDEQLTFSELNVTYYSGETDNAMSFENVEFIQTVDVTAMNKNGNDLDKKTTKVNFKNCTFDSGLNLANQFNRGGTVAVTVDGGVIANALGTAVLNVGYKAGDTDAGSNQLYIRGNVTVDNVTYTDNVNYTNEIDVIGSLTVNGKINKPAAQGKTSLLIQKDATLTLGENASFDVVENSTKIEGKLVNNGQLTVTVDASNKLADIVQNNNHEGQIVNYGILRAPMNEWYDNQFLQVYTAKGEYVITGVSTIDELDKAITVKQYLESGVVTGVELDAQTWDFKDDVDYSAYDLYINNTDAKLKAINGKFGNLIVLAGQKLTLDNGKTATTEFDNVVVNGELEITVVPNTYATTLKCDDAEVNKGGKLVHANQVDCANKTWGNGNTGTIVWD